MQRADNRIFTKVVDVDWKGSEGHRQGRQIVTVGCEAIDLRIGPVGNVEALHPRRNRDAMPGSELARPRAPAAKRQIVPDRLHGIGAQDAGRQYEVEVRITNGHVEHPIQLLDVGWYEIACSLEVVR